MPLHLCLPHSPFLNKKKKKRERERKIMEKMWRKPKKHLKWPRKMGKQTANIGTMRDFLDARATAICFTAFKGSGHVWPSDPHTCRDPYDMLKKILFPLCTTKSPEKRTATHHSALSMKQNTHYSPLSAFSCQTHRKKSFLIRFFLFFVSFHCPKLFILPSSLI